MLRVSLFSVTRCEPEPHHRPQLPASPPADSPPEQSALHEGAWPYGDTTYKVPGRASGNHLERAAVVCLASSCQPESADTVMTAYHNGRVRQQGRTRRISHRLKSARLPLGALSERIHHVSLFCTSRCHFDAHYRRRFHRNPRYSSDYYREFQGHLRSLWRRAACHHSRGQPRRVRLGYKSDTLV
jgi:hypothetical protein